MKRLLILALALLWCSATWAVGISTLKGTVRCEGKGVANVVVTDGESFTTTDAKGRFALPSSDDNKLIYITVPAGYRVAAEQSVPMNKYSIFQVQQEVRFQRKHLLKMTSYRY